MQVTINQNLKDHGSVFFTASTQHYWDRSGSDTFFQAGYSNSYKYGTYSITAGRTRMAQRSRTFLIFSKSEKEYDAAATIMPARSQFANWRGVTWRILSKSARLYKTLTTSHAGS